MNRDIKCKVSSNNSQWLLKKVAKRDRGLLFFCATLYTQKITYRRNSGLGSCRKCRHRRTTDHCLADEFSLADTDLQRDRQTDGRRNSGSASYSKIFKLSRSFFQLKSVQTGFLSSSSPSSPSQYFCKNATFQHTTSSPNLKHKKVSIICKFRPQ